MPVTLGFGAAVGVADIHYETNEATLQGMGFSVTTALEWNDGLADPPVENLVVVTLGGATVVPALVNGTVTLSPSEGFVRGDCNTDGNYDIGDGVAVLGGLFGRTDPSSCQDACDANDDGGVNIADAIYVLNNLFVEGPNPPTPFRACGGDGTSDDVSCEGYPPCM